MKHTTTNQTIVIAGITAVLLAIFCNIDRQKSETPKIDVVGECLTSVPKDKTAITLRVVAMDKNPAKSMQIATSKMNMITEYLKKETDVQMQTANFNSYEKTKWNSEKQESVVLGTETSISVEVSSDKTETIEKLLNTFAGDENIYTENLRLFTSKEKIKPVLEKCLSVAVENARERANALVSSDKKHAGKLLSVSYNDVSYGEHDYTNFRLMSAKAVSGTSFDTSGSIVSKDTEITVSVSATFEIK